MMKRGTHLVIILILVLAVIGIPLISAGFSDFLKGISEFSKITGKATSDNTSLNITIGNSAPVILFVNSISATNPVENSAVTIEFNFTANDSDGNTNLNDSTAEGRFQLAGETTRTNTSCSKIANSGNQANYSCAIEMYYFDKNDASWTVNVTIRDINDAVAENATTTFQYSLLTAMVMGPLALTWPSVGISDTNTGSDVDPVVLNNTGNAVDLDINVTAYDLQGEDTATDYIIAGNFTVQNITQGCSGTTMSNATPINVTSTILQRGNNTLDFSNATSGQEEIFFCLKEVNTSISVQSYSTAGGLPWEVRII